MSLCWGTKAQTETIRPSRRRSRKYHNKPKRRRKNLSCYSLGRETSKPLELAVFSQAKTCGRRYEAANGTFAEKLCCHASETGLKSLRCPNEASTEASTSAVRRSNRKKNSASPQHTTTKSIRSTRRNKMTSAVNSVATEGGRKKHVPPEPGAMRERIAAQFQRFIKMLHGRWE